MVYDTRVETREPPDCNAFRVILIYMIYRGQVSMTFRGHSH